MTQAVVQVRNIVARSGFANPLTLEVLVADEDYLKVYADTTLLDNGSDYEITGIGDPNGISIEIIGAEDVDNYVGVLTFTALYDPPYDQQSDLSAGGVLGRGFETGLDQQNRRMQALGDKVKRSLKVNVNIDDDIVLDPVDGQIPVWNESTGQFDFEESVPSTQAVAAAAEAAVSAAAAALSATDAETEADAAAASAAAAAIAETAAELAETNAETAATSAEAAQAAAEAAQAAAEAAVADALPLAGGTMTGPIGFTHQASPVNPAAGVLALFAKSDERMYTRTSAGVEIALGSGDVVEVATRTALKALDTTKDTVAVLTEAGREGSFMWKTGDFTARAAVDTAEGCTVKADAIALTIGAWVRANSVDLTPYMFGAVGNGSTDDYAALQAYANFCGYTGAPFRITDTAEHYPISAKIVCKVTRNLDPSDTSPASDLHFTDNLPFLIQGVGNAKLVATAAMDSMIELIFDTVDSDIGPFYSHVSGIHFDGGSVATAGIKSDYAMHGSYFNNRFDKLTRGIDYSGYGVMQISHNVFRCKYGVYLVGGGGDSAIMDNDFYSGENTSAGVYLGYYGGNLRIAGNVFTNSDGFSASYAVQAVGSTAAASEEIRHNVVSSNEFCGMTAGIHAVGKATGNRNIWDWVITGNHCTQFGASNPGTLLVAQDCTDFIIDSNQINGLRLGDASGKGINLTRCERFIIIGNLFGAIGAEAITMVDCIDTNVVENRFDNTGKTSAALAVVDISGSASLRNRVCRNVFRQSSASYAQLGVKESSSADFTFANDNDFYTVGTPYTSIGANSRMLTTVDNTVARYDGTTGRLQPSGVSVDDNGKISTVVSTGAPVELYVVRADNFSNGLTIAKRGATGDADAALANGGEIGYHSFYGWDSAAYSRGGYVIAKATEAWTASARGMSYGLFLTPNGSTTPVEVFLANHDGSLKLAQPLGGLGYKTGAGGTVTQATSKSTGVTLNKVTGQITMNAAALAAATIVSFVLTDSAIAAGDVLILNHVSGGTPGAYTLNARCAAGSATIDVRNNTAGSLSEAIVIGFALIRGVTS